MTLRRSTAVLAAAAALALTACGGGGEEPAASPGEGTIVVGITADPTQMLPWTVTSKQAIQVLSQVYSTLLDTGESSEPVAGLADLPEVSDDGLTYTFTLSEGVTFTDGSTLDSEDVKYTFDTIMDPDSKASSASYFGSVKSVEAPDPRTVVVTLEHPDASFPSGLTGVNTGIVPSDADPATLEKTPLGSGPYAWEKRTPNQSITLARNDSYFKGTPGAAHLEFRVIPDEQSMVSALRTGSVNLTVFDNPVTAKTAGTGSVTSTPVDSLSYHVLQLRAASPVLSDVNSRLAIQCAVSRQDVVDSAALGAGEVTGPVTSPEYRSDPAAQPCPEQDLDRAREYLAKAGTPDGFTLKLMTSQGLYSTAVDEAQAIQAQLGKVGIDVQLESLDSGDYVDRWLAGDFEAAIALNGGSSDPNTMYARYFTSDGSFNTVAGYSSKSLDTLFAQGIATTDTDERAEVYSEISAELVDNAVWVWLFTPKLFVVHTSSMSGLEARTDGSYSELWKASLG
ncbi:ABC transporter substrate-binding protein [Phycicoccus endophyticus]|uniref:ABC transporter substrate-binding protein n=1 Tax=Phycicoccus endophyticus TaxID=1690220 RepID=A0A7G9R1A6_9MICO|nr:ABC transporter substrate-binding protein [Phycicoccus endophyticus]NHI18844.1 ABC transporter substrate-binding protein [Phycicoccus endophyticus]QNN49381.1 ABC transporter substrate-binding protein [Phycicoccus endophyticus]GGL36085.1 ABC transporter substrate-binding protein [Phycicoccus endophyticus]